MRRVILGARIGRALIQSNQRSGEPELHYLQLPSKIHEHSVVVPDPQVTSGSSALMAITVLKDHEVRERKT